MDSSSSFNTDFWIVVCTAAPVIALSCIILMTDQLDLLSDRKTLKKIRLRKTKVHILLLANLSYWLNSVNIFFQALVFLTGLNALALKHLDVSLPFSNAPLPLIAALEAGGILALLVSSGFAAVTKIQVRKYELMQRNLAQQRAAKNNSTSTAEKDGGNAIKLRIGSPRFNIVVYRNDSKGSRAGGSDREPTTP